MKEFKTEVLTKTYERKKSRDAGWKVECSLLLRGQLNPENSGELDMWGERNMDILKGHLKSYYMEQKNGREIIILKLILEEEYSRIWVGFKWFRIASIAEYYGGHSHSTRRVNFVWMELTPISCKAGTEFLSIVQKKFVLPKINSKTGLQFTAPFFTVWMSKRRFWT